METPAGDANCIMIVHVCVCVCGGGGGGERRSMCMTVNSMKVVHADLGCAVGNVRGVHKDLLFPLVSMAMTLAEKLAALPRQYRAS